MSLIKPRHFIPPVVFATAALIVVGLGSIETESKARPNHVKKNEDGPPKTTVDLLFKYLLHKEPEPKPELKK